MKKMFFGAMLFFSGFLGILSLWITSIFKPWSYNDITGFHGFLLGTGTMPLFILSCIICAIGLVVCSIEAFFNR